MLATVFPRESLLHVVKTLPAAPQILASLGRMLLDLNADLTDVTALLRCDAALTTRMMRIANSAVYNVGAPTTRSSRRSRVWVSARFTGSPASLRPRRWPMKNFRSTASLARSFAKIRS